MTKWLNPSSANFRGDLGPTTIWVCLSLGDPQPLWSCSCFTFLTTEKSGTLKKRHVYLEGYHLHQNSQPCQLCALCAPYQGICQMTIRHVRSEIVAPNKEQSGNGPVSTLGNPFRMALHKWTCTPPQKKSVHKSPLFPQGGTVAWEMVSNNPRPTQNGSGFDLTTSKRVVHVTWACRQTVGILNKWAAPKKTAKARFRHVDPFKTGGTHPETQPPPWACRGSWLWLWPCPWAPAPAESDLGARLNMFPLSNIMEVHRGEGGQIPLVRFYCFWREASD